MRSCLSSFLGLTFLLLLFSCGSGTPDAIISGDSFKDSVADTTTRIKSDCQVVHGTVDIYDLCDEDSVVWSPDTLRRYKVNNPYHYKCSVVEDSLMLQFDINLNCAAEYTGDACMSDSILYFGFYEPRDSFDIATCDCNYRFIYKVPNLHYKKVIPVFGKASTKNVAGSDFLKALTQ